MTIKVSPEHFGAGAAIYRTDRDGLTPTIRGMLQAQARIAASAVTALTDNSGAPAADGTIGAISTFTKAVLGTDDCAQKAELEASFAALTDALKELIAQANAIHAVVPAMDGVLTDNITGTAVNGTIAAIDQSMTGVGTSLASAVGANTFVVSYRNAVAKLVYHVNKLLVACGVAELVDNSGGTVSFSRTFADISESTGTAVSGSDTTDANAAIKATDADTKLALLAAPIKEIATKLNACRSATGGALTVVAAKR
jgi:hypothetical protein